MKKLIAVGIAASFMLMATPAQAADPTPPSDWQLPNRGVVKYMKWNGQDCWKFHHVIRCVK